jgi:hypothetical protein
MLDTSPKQLGVREILLSAFAAGIAIFVAACSGINGMNTPGGVPAAQTMTQIKIGGFRGHRRARVTHEPKRLFGARSLCATTR